MLPNDPVARYFRLVPSQTSALKRLGIVTIEDLLYHFPARYDQGGSEATIAGLVPGTSVTLFGTIHKLDTRKSWKRRIPVGEGVLRDASGSIKIMWFHQPYLAKKFVEGMFVKAVGTISGKEGKVYLANPHVEVADPSEIGLFKQHQNDVRPTFDSALFAVYPETAGITSLWMRHALERVFSEGAHMHIDDPIPDDVRERLHLPDLASALLWIHRPEKDTQAQAARKRFAFEEMFAIQTARALDRAENDAQKTFAIGDAHARANEFLGSIPFPPTRAQIRAIDDILKDFSRAHPMARLLEGDVGSGKTLVAAASAYAIVTARPPKRTSGTLQVAYMAPTEILATQHFESFIAYFKDLPINIGLITGSGCKKFPSKVGKGKATDISRTQLLKWVKNGEIAMLIGTHALIQKSVQFQHLALAIIDEQHRFGTKQRRALAQKNTSSAEKGGKSDFLSEDCLSVASSAGQKIRLPALPTPHFLSMTATPIPRTLALTIYGDLDISVLDELPPGRAKIATRIIKKDQRDEAYTLVRSELIKGRQAYVICPRIEEPDPTKIGALQARSAKAEQKRLQKDIFPEYEVEILHGAMPAKSRSASGGKPTKEQVMKDFADHKIDILVATSVVEVGVNVPNATAIMIEGAERFGLAQLHQLRGRVMRSSHSPLCLLLPETTGELSLKRLKTLAASQDGFALAEADLEARGAGDLAGRQQWGVTDIGMEALKNVKLIQAAREEAQRIVAQDPTLSQHETLRLRIQAAQAELHNE
ncbi:ATP-dependent DNA helicase RecG [Candidatus Kaiserbacteria bacterium]|nr:ATP-dependent DNA helicase RecG [Candidatus Kaiserbacteria bacterium]